MTSDRLTRIATEVMGVRAKAEANMKRTGRVAGRINGEPSLSTEGRQRALQQLVNENKTVMTALRDEEKAILEREARDIESSLLGRVGTRPEDLIAFRDAQDRADSIDNAKDALRIMQRALLSGDTTLAHAVYRIAVDNRWADVMNPFETEHPDTSGAVRDLADIRHSLTGRSMHRAAAYMPLTVQAAQAVTPIVPDDPGEAIWKNYLAESRGETNQEDTEVQEWAKRLFTSNGGNPAPAFKTIDVSGYGDDA